MKKIISLIASFTFLNASDNHLTLPFTPSWVDPSCITRLSPTYIDNNQASNHMVLMLYLASEDLDSGVLKTSAEVPYAGRTTPYDRGSEIILSALHQQILHTGAGIVVLDVGCGSGYLASLMSYTADGVKPLDIWAIDGVLENIEDTLKKYAHVNKVIGPVPNVKLTAQTSMLHNLALLRGLPSKANLICCQNVLHLMSHNEKIVAIKSLYDRLQPGGQLFLAILIGILLE